MEYILSAVFSTIQFLAAIYFFDAFLPRKSEGKTFWGTFLIWTAFSILVINLEGSALSVLKIFLVPLLLVGFAFLLYSGSIALRLFMSVIVYALFNVILYFCEFFTMSLLGLNRSDFVYNRVLYTSSTLVGTTLILTIALLIKHFHSPRTVSWGWVVLVAFYPFTTILVLFLLYQTLAGTGAEPTPQAIRFSFICLGVMAIANVVVLVMVDWMQTVIADREKNLAVGERMRSHEESVAALSDAYARQRKLIHDFRNHMDVLAHLLDTGCTEQATAYVHDLEQTQSERILLVKTHNAALDALLNLKSYTAQQKQIDLHYEVNDLSQLQIKSLDFIVVLGNLLDNAIDACEKLPVAQRWMRIRVISQKSENDEPPVVSVSVQNSSLQVKIVHNRIATTKPDASLHGFGLPNVIEILEKYHAEYVMNYEDGRFLFSIEWPDVKL